MVVAPCPCVLPQVVFQPQKEGKQLLQQDPAQLLARNDPTAPQPVQAPPQEDRAQKPYQFLVVSTLREYLALELRIETPFPWDIERIFDDFGGLLAFACMRAGTAMVLTQHEPG